jgi:hypothetical protein
MYPRPFECRFGFYQPVNGSDGHSLYRKCTADVSA